MFEAFEVQEDAPRDIQWFEQLWGLGLVVSVVIALGMYDYSAMIVGHFRAVLINVVLFAIAIGLMGFASRRRSNVARWLLIPFALLILFYDLARFSEMLDRGWIAYFTVARVGLMVGAIYFLFRPRSRAWFAGTPLPPGGPDEDWS
ncbi:hypothetical protein [Reyranella sp.]|uniref:hypothetical protein n=1 Tax=Reyranella sp. TaxID=1929291 RepID=UPI00273066E3|nr:hypothetical protein [Reyranella sp.]MDP2373634.1 hypothetical protein [Reyranella sp.]